jgi:Ca2+/Na+ antiporter
VISIRDARDGDYDDAVANALGSNIFDICFALGFPLFVYTLINGPIQLTEGVARQSAELRFLLLCLTILGFFAYYTGPKKKSESGIQYVEMKRGKAVLLISLYLLFVAYVIGLSADAAWATSISDKIQAVLTTLPKTG